MIELFNFVVRFILKWLTLILDFDPHPHPIGESPVRFWPGLCPITPSPTPRYWESPNDGKSLIYFPPSPEPLFFFAPSPFSKIPTLSCLSHLVRRELNLKSCVSCSLCSCLTKCFFEKTLMKCSLTYCFGGVKVRTEFLSKDGQVFFLMVIK